MEDINLEDILNAIKELDTVKKLNRIIFAYRLTYSHLVSSINSNFWLFNNEYYLVNFIKPVLNDINLLIGNKKKDIINVFNFNNLDIEPWLATRFEAEKDKESKVAIYLYFQSISKGYKAFDFKELVTNSKNSDDKYGLTRVKSNLIADNRGIRLDDNFYFYHPFFDISVAGDKAPEIFHQINAIDSNNITNLSIRLLDSLSVPIKEYNKINYEFSEKYYGPNYELEKISFKETIGTTVHFDTKTGNKIFIRLSVVDGDKWVEIEEMPKVINDSKYIKTKSIHSIFNFSTNQLVHIDGHVNYYEKSIYEEMYNTTKMKKTAYHVKLWLLEGSLYIKDWGNLCISYLDNVKLLNEIFNGRIGDELIKN